MKRAALLFILLLAFAGAPWLSPIHAQGVTPTPATTQGFNPIPSAEEVGKIVDEKAKAGQTSKELYSVNTQAILSGGVVCMITGCSEDKESGFYYGKSPLAMMGNAIGTIYANPPADLALWIQDTGQSLGFIPKQAYAQGIGFTGFSALLPLWKAFRNIAYALLAAIMVIIGFMVMFRKKIDPKTVVTVQNALPKIVLTLILITFSYAIVGLMIDLMYLVILLMVGLVNSTGLLPTSLPTGVSQIMGYKNIADVMSRGGLIAVYNTIFPGFSLTKVAGDLVGYNLGWVATGLVGGAALGFLFASPVVGAVTAGVVVGAPIIIQLLLSLALLFTFVRLLILFIGAYVQIVLALIIGPLQIMTEAIPGSNGFGSWIKNLFANLVVFPIAAGMFLLSMAFLTATDKFSGSIWTPPFATLPGASVRSISALFALGVLMVIPNIAQGIKEALKNKPIIPAGPGALFAPITGAVQTTMGTASQFYYGSAMVGQLGTWLGKKKPETPGKG